MVNLQCWKQVLYASGILSKYLQSGSIDITTALDLIGGFKEQMAKLRTDDSFEKLQIAANNSLAACGIKEDFVPSRKFATPADADHYLKCHVFYSLHDRLQAELETKSDDSSNICSLFSALDPKNYNTEGNKERLKQLCDIYVKDVDLDSVLCEFSSLMSTLHSIFKTAKDLPKSNDVLAFLIERGMENVFPNMSILYRIFLTIPVTSAHAERSFSRLKLIKSYLRSVMGQERLTSLSLLSIERGISSMCDYDSVIDNFAAMKTRRKKL